MRYNAVKGFHVVDTKGNKQYIEKGNIISDYGDDVLCSDMFINYDSNTPFVLSGQQQETLLKKRKENYCVYRSFMYPGAFVDVLFTGSEEECNRYFDKVNKEIYNKHKRADVEQVWVRGILRRNKYGKII